MANESVRTNAHPSLPVHILGLLARVVHIAYAFTKSDYKTTVIPVVSEFICLPS